MEAKTALTIADGIAVKRPGGIPLEILRTHLDDLVVVDEEATAAAMALLLERCKLVVEGAGAVGVAAILGDKLEPIDGTTVAVLSGGNVDATLLAAIARRHETEAGRRLVALTRIPDRPGGLATLLASVAGTGANIVDVSHVREGLDLHVRETAVELVLETRGHEHAQRVLSALTGRGLPDPGAALKTGSLPGCSDASSSPPAPRCSWRPPRRTPTRSCTSTRATSGPPARTAPTRSS